MVDQEDVLSGLGGGRLAQLVVEIGDDDLGSALDDELGLRRALTAGRAGDDGDLARKLLRHVLPLLLMPVGVLRQGPSLGDIYCRGDIMPSE